MAQSLANVLVHLVFSTKNRVPLILPEIDGELHAYLATICGAHHCPAHRIGGDCDHVHIACSLSRTVALARLLEELKSSSSKWIKTKGTAYAGFAWQAGYGAFSVGQSQLAALKAYISRQREHHRKQTFQDEYRDFLRQYQVDFDERYVWD
jgi:putative transposase